MHRTTPSFGPRGARDLCRDASIRERCHSRGKPTTFIVRNPNRSEEHTSELQSQSNLVCRLLLEKKKNRSTRRPYCSDSPEEYAQNPALPRIPRYYRTINTLHFRPVRMLPVFGPTSLRISAHCRG